MAIAVLLLMTLGIPLQESSPHPMSTLSDSTRVAVTRAALDHAISVAIEEMLADPERTFVVLRGPQEGVDASEWADSAAVVAVAEERGLEVRDTDLQEHPAWLACQEDRRSTACRAARGVAALSVGRVNVLGPERANARISIHVLATISRGSAGYGDSVRGQRLRLEKVGDEWKVVGFGITIVS